MTRAKDISKIVTDADLSGTLDVTGTVTAGGLTVDGLTTASKANDSKQLKLERTGSSVGSSFLGSDTSAAMHIFDSGSNPVATFYQNQDVAFYEDTGTTPKLFWDSSAERLKIGDSSANTAGGLVVGSDSGGVITVTKNGGTYAQDDLIGSLNWYTEDASLDGPNVTARIAAFANGVSGDDAYLTFSTKAQPLGADAAESMRIDSSGNVGIGETSPLSKLHVKGADSGADVFTDTYLTLENSGDTRMTILSGTSNVGGIKFGDSGLNRQGGIDYFHADDSMRFATTNSERMRIDSNGNVGIGGTPTNASDHKSLALFGASGNGAGLIEFNDTSGNADGVIFVDNGTLFINADYDNTTASSTIRFRIDGSSEKMRIDSSGNLLVGTTSSNSTSGTGARLKSGGRGDFTTSGGLCSIMNRKSNDGVLIDFQQDNTGEGNISVSGTTVSYNGGHLSRWSQLADNTRDNTIVKGTVMTNLDQMAEWTTNGVTEDNEQLNCMAVSSVEGDANVAGVFVNWDDDDDIYTNDMNIAMTGDMVIRIAQGTTVARGDLLMSAGDGTAKPQGEDIVRSKTIAKVTSTNVSHTYDDGTYLVPCVLMAC